MKKIKTIDFLIASEIFGLAILEFISWIFWFTEDYKGLVAGSDYLIYRYPLCCTLGFLWVAICKILKTKRFKVCIYTKIISWSFLIIQIFNLLALYIKFGIEFYSLIIYPMFLCTLISLIIIKMIRWASSKR